MYPLSPGRFERSGIHGWRSDLSVGFDCLSPVGTLMAVHCASVGIHDYMTFYSEESRYYPFFYATMEDWSLMHSEREVIVTEGVFDRIAVKRAVPNYAVVARLTKGISRVMQDYFDIMEMKVWLALDMDKYGMDTRKKMEKVRSDAVYNSIEFPYKDPS